MINKTYLTTKDKKYIKNYCKLQMENEELIRVKSLASLLSKKYALFEIMQYIKEDLKITQDKIFYGVADYIVKLPRGHIQLTNDLFFDRCYLHQYILCQELELDMEQIQEYVIHHIDQDKGNNDIENLWTFYDVASHTAYHQAIKHNTDINIKEFTENYVESIINKDNAARIRKYLEILDRLENAKRKKCLDIGVSKTLNFCVI